MKKNTGNIRELGINYIYDNSRKGAKYSVNNGKSWINGGEMAEIGTKAVFGIETLEKDANTPFDKGSDIEELEMSVKSSKFTLCCPIGKTWDETITNYFQRVHSTSWGYAVIIEDEITVYTMNKAEFKEFLETWANWDESRKVVRGKATSGKMIKWFEERA